MKSPLANERKFVCLQNNIIYGSKSKAERDIQKNIVNNFGAFPQASIRSAMDDFEFTYYSFQMILDNHDIHPYKFIKFKL